MRGSVTGDWNFSFFYKCGFFFKVVRFIKWRATQLFQPLHGQMSLYLCY